MTQPYGQEPGQYGAGSGGYPGGYQPGHSYQQPGYAVPTGSPGPYAYGGGPGARPGPVTAAGVLAFVQGGITAITTIVLLTGIGDSSGPDVAITVLVVFAQAAGVALLIAGGVRVLAGTGRGVLVSGCVVELVVCLFYVIGFVGAASFGVIPDAARGPLVAFALLFAVMPAISMSLALGAAATRFLGR